VARNLFVPLVLKCVSERELRKLELKISKV